MQPARQNCLFAFFCLIALSALAPFVRADILTITSAPPGATVEIDGKPVGPTPYKIDYPGGYFHKTHSVFGERLEHSMILRVSKDGYLPQQVTITTGPFEWVGLTGHHHGSYFLLRADRFNIRLEPVSKRGEFSDTSSGAGPLRPYRFASDDSETVSPVPGATTAVHPSNAKEVVAGGITITSDMTEAEIYADGKFVGQTPSTIHLTSGLHLIEVKAEGKQTWSRNLEVTDDSQITLNAVFAVSP